MTDGLEERITVRMFIGCLLTSDLQYLLNQSHTWKEWMLAQEASSLSPSILKVRFRSKSYLGSYCLQENVPISEVERLQTFLREKLSELFPSSESEKLNIHIFPQVFIS